jgi:hypothetical protein
MSIVALRLWRNATPGGGHFEHKLEAKIVSPKGIACDAFKSRLGRLCRHSRSNRETHFFTESLILAQDERWRRA